MAMRTSKLQGYFWVSLCVSFQHPRSINSITTQEYRTERQKLSLRSQHQLKYKKQEKEKEASKEIGHINSGMEISILVTSASSIVKTLYC